jgi:hypothetical protein
MRFQCKIRPCAVPVVDITTHDGKGKLLKKPIKRTKVVKFGGIVGWVDRCSRKHFNALDADAKALNKQDYAEMVAECKELNVPVPDDATFALLADSLAAIHAKASAKAVSVATPLLVPSTDDEPTNAELRAQCKDKGIKTYPNDNKAKLKQRLATA